MSRTTRISRRNLPWRPSNNIWLAGPVDVPPGLVDDARARLVALGSRPEARRAAVLRRLDPGAGTLTEVDEDVWAEHASGLVVAAESPHWDGEATLPRLAAREQDLPLAGLPFRLSVGPDWVSFQFNHALGDSSALWPVFVALSHPDTAFDALPLAEPQGWTPLRRALRHTFARRGGGLVRVVRSERDAVPLAGSGTAQLAPRARAAHGVSDPGFRKVLRAVAPGSGLSVASLLVGRAHAVARDLAIPLHPGVAMVVDCRRYLPERSYVEGNFVAGSYLALDDPTDPVAAHRAIEELVDSGRPLLSMSANALLTPRRPDVEEFTAPDPQGRSLLSLSHVGRMPWPRGGLEPPVTTALSRAIGDHGIALIGVETRERLIVSVTWAEGHQDPELMHRFAQAIVGREVHRDQVAPEHASPTPAPGTP